MKRKTENGPDRGHTTVVDIEAGLQKEDIDTEESLRQTPEKKKRKNGKKNVQLSLILLLVFLFKVTNIIKTKSIGKRKR
jgi:hypothetical protein